MIPYGRQSISAEDRAAVMAVLESDWLTQGPCIPRFEAEAAALCDVPHAVAVSNGTTALHLACLALDVGPGDHVWTSPITFVASANCARYCGARVDFVDITPDSLNLDPGCLADKLTRARQAGCLPKVVIPVHFAGRPCDMAAIGALAKEFGFHIIEDACHAFGAREQDGSPVGACRHSDMTVTSFHPVKMITTGEGGLITTRSNALAQRLCRLRSHGIVRNPDEMTQLADGPWYYEQIELGYNARLTDIQAALGSSQLQRLPQFLQRRRALVQRYRERLGHLPLTLPAQGEDERTSWHLFVVRVAAERRRKVFEDLRASGIGVNVHYIPVHLQPDYRRLGFEAGMFPVAEAYYRETITLPLFPGLEDAEQDAVIAAVTESLGNTP